MSLSSMLEHGDQLQAPVIPNPHPTCLPDTYLLLHRLLKPEMKVNAIHPADCAQHVSFGKRRRGTCVDFRVFTMIIVSHG